MEPPSPGTKPKPIEPPSPGRVMKEMGQQPKMVPMLEVKPDAKKKK